MDPGAIMSGLQQGFNTLGSGFNLGFGIHDFFSGAGDTAQNDARFMNDFAWKQSLRNEQFQKDLASHGLRMRVNDAVEAGLHPLVGAGINPANGGWSGAAFSGSAERYPRQPLPLGHNVSRAVDATSTGEEKILRALEIHRQMTQLEGDELQLQILRKQLDEMDKTPPMPTPSPSIPNKFQLFRNSDGTITQGYSSDYSQSIMSDPIGMWAQSLKKALGGPDADPFWDMFGRSALRLMQPWKRRK